MKTYACFLFVCVLIPLGINAQQHPYFSNLYSISADTSNLANGVAKVGDNYVVSVGAVNQTNGKEFGGLILIDEYGEVQWVTNLYTDENTFDIGFNDPLAVIDSSIYVSGHIRDSITGIDPTLIATNDEGIVEHSTTYAQPYRSNGGALHPLQDGNLILLGSQDDSTQSSNRPRLMKLSPAGEELWNNIYQDHNVKTKPWHATELSDRNILIASTVCPGGNCITNRRGQLRKLDEDGNELWVKEYGGGLVQPRGQVLQLDENRLAYAWTIDTFHYTTSRNPPRIYFLDLEGEVLSHYTFYGIQRQLGGIKKMNNGDLVGVGITKDEGILEWTAWMWRMTAEGELLWERQIRDTRYLDSSGGFNSYLEDLVELPDGDILTVGRIGVPGKSYVWVLRTGPNGCWDADCSEGLMIFTDTKEPTGNQVQAGGLSVYPNPATEMVNVSLLRPLTSIAKLCIVDMHSRVLHTHHLSAGSSTCKLDVNHLPPGCYTLTLQSTTGRTARKLIVR